MSSLTLQSTVKLRDGNEIPVLGFGVYELEGEDTYKAVTWALEAGYRHVDSAAWYENEEECGRAILDFCKKHSVPRSDIFYTTKLKANAGLEATHKAIEKSLQVCGLGYVDLYLIHGPIGGPRMRRESWQACIEAQKKGLLKSIGVSNYGMGHLKEMIDDGEPLPAINQIDLHPFMTRNAIVELCKKHNIVLQAWGPLVRGMRFQHPTIVKFAERYNKQPAQLLLRYSLQKGYVPLPKSASKARVESNADIFDFTITSAEISELDALDEYLLTDWDPTDCE